MTRFLVPLLLLATLSACSSDLRELRELNPAAEDFKGALAAEYRAFADSEDEQGRSRAAERFAAKGVHAYHGIDVAPDALDSSLEGAEATALADARAQLVRLLKADVKEAAPQELARAQLLFDCWQHQVVSGVAPEKALCEGEFAPALNRVIETAGPAVYDEAFRRSITFLPNVTTLTAEHIDNIRDVVCQLADAGDDYWVELRAYVGKKASQRKLTEARLAAVKKVLMKGGVPAQQIRIRREGGNGVMLSRDNIPMNTKVVTITITAETQGKGK